MAPIKVKKPKAILFDLSGTATKSYFTDQILFPYIKQNCQTYISNNWNNEILQRDIQRLREQSQKDSGPEIAEKEATRSEIERSVCSYVFKCLEDLRENDAINIFRLHMWFDGYNRNKLETPVYSDVAIQIKHWRITQNVKLFVLSNGWTEATKRFMSKTNHGDLNLLIEDHFDTTIGSLTDPETYKKVLSKIGMEPGDVIFLTKSVPECKAARAAGINAILVMTHRRDLARISDKDDGMPQVVRSFNEIMLVTDGSETVSAVSTSSDVSSAAPSSASSSASSSAATSSESKLKSKKSSRASSHGGSSSAATSTSKNSESSGGGVPTFVIQSMLATKPKSADGTICGTIYSAKGSKTTSGSRSSMTTTGSSLKSGATTTSSMKSGASTTTSTSSMKSGASSSSSSGASTEMDNLLNTSGIPSNLKSKSALVAAALSAAAAKSTKGSVVVVNLGSKTKQSTSRTSSRTANSISNTGSSSTGGSSASSAPGSSSVTSSSRQSSAAGSVAGSRTGKSKSNKSTSSKNKKTGSSTGGGSRSKLTSGTSSAASSASGSSASGSVTSGASSAVSGTKTSKTSGISVMGSSKSGTRHSSAADSSVASSTSASSRKPSSKSSMKSKKSSSSSSG